MGENLGNLLRKQDYEALQKSDYDLYKLANPTLYDHLSQWEKARLVTRVSLQYGTLVDGAVHTAQLAGKIGAAAAGDFRVLARGLAQDLEKGQVPKSSVLRPPSETARAPAASQSKPPLPPAEADVRGVPRFNPDVPAHKLAAQAEKELAETVHNLPGQVVVRWGDPIGSHGADVISVNQRTGEVILWDSKARTASTAIQPSPTFAPKSNSLASAIKQARESIEKNQTLPPDIRSESAR